ncbi:MAG TPA: peptide chain release factor-like protein [Humisphaera sp.]
MERAAPILFRSPRFLSDDALLAESREDHYRGSGPGGQKRNKTSNAVRIVHGPTGVVVTATESRSLKENRLQAIRRLRNRLAADVREPVDLVRFAPPDWFLSIRHDTRIEASHRHPYHAPAAGLVLDLLAALGGNPAAVAVNLGVSTTAVVKLLESEGEFWQAANRIRAAHGLEALTHRR